MRKLLTISLLLLATIAAAQVGYEVQPVSFNTNDADEYAPVLFGDGVLFVSNRKNSVVLQHTSADGTPLTDLYYAPMKRTTRFGTPHLLDKSLTTVFHEGPASATADGSLLAFTRSTNIDKKFGSALRENNPLGIFFAAKQGKHWQVTEPFAHNSAQHNVGHPALSPDGTTMYFISDMPGGMGGTDLYVCEKQANGWSAPRNLGPGINTPGNEMFPFMHENGMLFFSSDSLGGLGGLDVFYTQKVEGVWVQPVNLKAPLNSPADDFGFIADHTNQQGYMCSNRHKSDDVYAWKAVFPDFENCDSLQVNNHCYAFYETTSMELDTMPLKYEWDLGDGSFIRSLEAEYCYTVPGTYLIMLNIVDTLTGDVFFNEASYELVIEDAVQPYITCPDSVKPGVAVRFDGIETNLPGWDVDEYVWDFGDGVHAFGLVTEHAFRDPGIYTVRLGVNGAADTAGVVPKACVYKTVVVSDSLPFESSAVAYSDVKQAAYDYRNQPLKPMLVLVSSVLDQRLDPYNERTYDLYELAPDASFFELMLAHDPDTAYLNSKRGALAELDPETNFYEVLKALDLDADFDTIGKGFDYARLPPDVNAYGLAAALENWFNSQQITPPQPAQGTTQSLPPNRSALPLIQAIDTRLGDGSNTDFNIDLLPEDAHIGTLIAALDPEGNYNLPPDFSIDSMPAGATFSDVLQKLELQQAFSNVASETDFSALPANVPVLELVATVAENRVQAHQEEEATKEFYPPVLTPMSAEGFRPIDVVDPGTVSLQSQGFKEEISWAVDVATSLTQIPLEDPQFDPLKPDYEVSERFADTDSLFHYSVGDEENITETYPIFKDVEARGFTPEVARIVRDTVPMERTESLQLTEVRWNDAVQQIQQPGYRKPAAAAPPAQFRTTRVHIVYFETGAFELDEPDIENLNQVVARMLDEPELHLAVAGHTDSKGAAAANTQLSQNRALAARQFLIKSGVAAERVSIQWFGSSQPMGDNNTEKGQQLNRRVEIRLMKDVLN